MWIVVAETTIILVSVCFELIAISLICKLSWVCDSVGESKFWRSFLFFSHSYFICSKGQVGSITSPNSHQPAMGTGVVYKPTSQTDAMPAMIQGTFSPFSLGSLWIGPLTLWLPSSSSQKEVYSLKGLVYGNVSSTWRHGNVLKSVAWEVLPQVLGARYVWRKHMTMDFCGQSTQAVGFGPKVMDLRPNDIHCLF